MQNDFSHSVNQIKNAIRGASHGFLLTQSAKQSAHMPMRPKIRAHRKIQRPNFALPSGCIHDRIYTYGNRQRLPGFQLLALRLKLGELHAGNFRPVRRIKRKQNIFLSAQTTQAEFPLHTANDGGKLEFGSESSWRQKTHLNFSSVISPASAPTREDSDS